MIFEIISGGGKTDWVGKEWAGLFFPRGKNGPAHSFPGEKTDWGEIPACYTGPILSWRLIVKQFLCSFSCNQEGLLSVISESCAQSTG